jgi:hypothetical protein
MVMMWSEFLRYVSGSESLCNHSWRIFHGGEWISAAGFYGAEFYINVDQYSALVFMMRTVSVGRSSRHGWNSTLSFMTWNESARGFMVRNNTDIFGDPSWIFKYKKSLRSTGNTWSSSVKRNRTTKFHAALPCNPEVIVNSWRVACAHITNDLFTWFYRYPQVGIVISKFN